MSINEWWYKAKPFKRKDKLHPEVGKWVNLMGFTRPKKVARESVLGGSEKTLKRPELGSSYEKKYGLKVIDGHRDNPFDEVYLEIDTIDGTIYLAGRFQGSEEVLFAPAKDMDVSTSNQYIIRVWQKLK